MFLGEFEHLIDEKNRLTLPAKFREALADGVVVTRGMDGCLSAYPSTGGMPSSSRGSAPSTRSVRTIA